MSKHEDILKYIRGLREGSSLSVRQISGYMGVSLGTSYRAIKQAEQDGLVKTVERVGTFRIVQREVKSHGKIMFREVNRVIQGTVLSGDNYLDKEISRILIGAMQTEDLVKYLEPNGLLIVGNREKSQRKALENGVGLLITGGFGTGEEILKLAEEKQLPVISTTHDSFTCASIIHREVYSLSLSQNIVTAGSLMVKQEQYTIDINELGTEIHPEDKNMILLNGNRFVGAIRSKYLDEMTKDNYTSYLLPDYSAEEDTTLLSLRQIMSWHQLNIIPVVESGDYRGIVHRREVFKNISSRNLKSGMSTDQLIDREIKIDSNKINIRVMPFMADEYGSLSQANFMRLAERLILVVLQENDIHSYHIDTYNIMNFKIVQLYQEIELTGEIIDRGEQFIRLEIILNVQGTAYSKATFMIQHFNEK
ncbi:MULTISPECIES: DRTGG domain-containing protein [Jeotgalicoccus]|uniref:GntR family transcriptional regulator n=1 Tax=Jeotgalicoccus nanhaiensis TaxID=568603 RepID=A0ABR9XYU7_9STAP|nr:DRTGG domain-containing protein [Jeotgalicoccus nanhaiensis]MBF0754052.1 GntR family transcriptional regulator [Jeotgalicoccus nanhaiensis]TFU61538.1 GntR family transcriptional regulator [Jeotgalicoccus nanhaiensis]